MLGEDPSAKSQPELYLVRVKAAEIPVGLGAMASGFALYERAGIEFRMVAVADAVEKLTSSVDPSRISHDVPEELLGTSLQYVPKRDDWIYVITERLSPEDDGKETADAQAALAGK